MSVSRFLVGKWEEKKREEKEKKKWKKRKWSIFGFKNFLKDKKLFSVIDPLSFDGNGLFLKMEFERLML